MRSREHTEVQVNGLVFCTVDTGTDRHLLLKSVRVERGLGATCGRRKDGQ